MTIFWAVSTAFWGFALGWDVGHGEFNWAMVDSVFFIASLYYLNRRTAR